VIGGDEARAWIASFVEAFRAQRGELDELDRRSGDGDFGSNLLPAIEGSADAAAGLGPGRCFTTLGRAFMAAGGTSGPIFGVWLRELGRAGGDAEQLDLAAIASGCSAGLEAVRALGGASVGDKTMIDALDPAASALAQAAEHGEDLGTALDAAAAAARAGAQSTAGLLARRGRASYVGEASRGVEDPGAVAVALFFEAHP